MVARLLRTFVGILSVLTIPAISHAPSSLQLTASEQLAAFLFPETLQQIPNVYEPVYVNNNDTASNDGYVSYHSNPPVDNTYVQDDVHDYSLDFLNEDPDMQTYTGDPSYLIAANNPGRGYCGWAALSYHLNSRFEVAVELREELLDWWLDLSADPVRLHHFRQTIMQHEGLNELDETQDAWIQNMPLTLTALPNERDGHNGFVADLNSIGIWAFALQHNLVIHIHSMDNHGRDVLNEVVNQQGGQHVHLFQRGAHWQALEPADDMNDVLSAGIPVATKTSLPPVKVPAKVPSEVPAKPPGKVPTEQSSSTKDAIPQQLPPQAWPFAKKDLSKILDLLKGLLQYKEPAVRTAKQLKALVPCPPVKDGLYARILRYSRERKFSEAHWQALINQEETLTLAWIRANLNPAVLLGDIRIIVLNDVSAMGEVGDLFSDTGCANITLPNRPSALLALLRQNRVRHLLITTADGIAVQNAILQRFLVDARNIPCIPQFPITVFNHLHLAMGAASGVTTTADSLIRSLSKGLGQPLPDVDKLILSGMREGLLQRLAQSLGGRISSMGRNKLTDVSVDNAGTLRDLSLFEYQTLEITLRDVLDMPDTEPLLKPDSIASLPTQPTGKKHIRFVRYSTSVGIPKGGKMEEFILGQQVRTATELTKQLQQDISPEQVQVVIACGSALTWTDDLWRVNTASVPDKARAIHLRNALRLGDIATLSLPSADTLVCRPRALQDLFTNNGTSRPTSPLMVFGGLDHFQRYDTTELLESFSSSTAAGANLQYQTALARARVQRLLVNLAQSLTTRSRNTQRDFMYTLPAPGTYNTNKIKGKSRYTCLIPDDTGKVCGALCADLSHFQIHRVVFHPDNNTEVGKKRHCCQVPGCGRHFAWRSQWLIHKRQHEGYIWECTIKGCDEKFTSPEKRAAHKKATHRPSTSGDATPGSSTGIPPSETHDCVVPGCDASYSGCQASSKLKRHIRKGDHGQTPINYGQEAPRKRFRFEEMEKIETAGGFACDQCAAIYSREGSLATHIRAGKHTIKPKAFPCQVEGCRHSFYSADALAKHMDSTHDAPPSKRRKIFRGFE